MPGGHLKGLGFRFDLREQVRVLNGDGGLVRERLHKGDLRVCERLNPVYLAQHQPADRFAFSQDGHGEASRRRR